MGKRIVVILLVVSCGLIIVPVGFARQGTQIVLLGTGTPNADPERSGPAVAIVVGETPYIIDCGPGIVRRAAAAVRKGVKALEVSNLRTASVNFSRISIHQGSPVRERLVLTAYGPAGME